MKLQFFFLWLTFTRLRFIRFRGGWHRMKKCSLYLFHCLVWTECVSAVYSVLSFSLQLCNKCFQLSLLLGPFCHSLPSLSVCLQPCHLQYLQEHTSLHPSLPLCTKLLPLTIFNSFLMTRIFREPEFTFGKLLSKLRFLLEVKKI